VFLDSENQKSQLYYMPMPESIDCLSDKSEYANEMRGAFSKVAFKRVPIRDKSLFEVKNETQRVLIIRLDLAESLLMRDYKGFVLSETVIEP